jgi:hypothetical protein
MSLPTNVGFIVRCTPTGEPKRKSHIWLGTDTACRMWSTGGLIQTKRWDYYIEPPTEICTLCHPERYGIESPVVREPTLFD